jgi:hypothetical protein
MMLTLRSFWFSVGAHTLPYFCFNFIAHPWRVIRLDFYIFVWKTKFWYGYDSVCNILNKGVNIIILTPPWLSLMRSFLTGSWNPGNKRSTVDTESSSHLVDESKNIEITKFSIKDVKLRKYGLNIIVNNY